MNENTMTVWDNNDESMIMDLTGERNTAYCSFTPTNEKERAQLFNAMNNPDERLADHINEALEISHIFAEMVPCTNKETGVTTICPRIVLIDKNGKSFQCVSLGIFSALKKIFQLYGQPVTWEKPIKLKVVQITKGTNKMLTLSVVA